MKISDNLCKSLCIYDRRSPAHTKGGWGSINSGGIQTQHLVSQRSIWNTTSCVWPYI